MADSTTTNPGGTTAAPEHPLCSMCTKPAPMQCHSCKCSRYCSAACQKLDWPTHKLVCKKFKDFDASHRPAPDQIRAIYFPNDESTPRFIWIGFKSTGHQMDFGMIDRDSMPPSAKAFTNIPCFVNYLEANSVFQRPYAGMIGNWTGGLCKDGYPPNQSMGKLDKILPSVANGPAIFYGQGRDLDTMDFRHMVDHCLQFYWESAVKDIQESIEKGETVEGVRINCIGDIHVSERPAIETYRLPVSTCDVDSEIKFPVGDSIAIPLVVGHIKDCPAWRDRYTPNDGRLCIINNMVADLHPPELEKRTGSAAVVRKDKKPLPLPHMLALVKYCRGLSDEYHAQVAPVTFDSAAKEGRMAARRFLAAEAEFIHEHASQAGFAKFYKEWLEKDGREEYRRLPSPYDV